MLELNPLLKKMQSLHKKEPFRAEETWKIP